MFSNSRRRVEQIGGLNMNYPPFLKAVDKLLDKRGHIIYDNKVEFKFLENKEEDVEASILEKANIQGHITRNEIEQSFGFGTTKAYCLLKALCDKGLLVQRKNGKMTAYYPAGKDIRTQS